MKRLWRNIAVPSKITKRRLSKKQSVLDFAASRGWARIGEAEWGELRAALPDVSVGVIQSSGLEIDAPWCGIRQHTFEELEESLRTFSAVYAARLDLRSACRAQVIAAKDRAKWLSRSKPYKAEMAEWMLVWLGDPSVFPVWVDALRMKGHGAILRA